MMTTQPGERTHSAMSVVGTWALLLILVTCGRAVGGESGHPDPDRQPFLKRFHPAGGWHPDGGGLLHWWNPRCFPRCGGPDDYCRKPAPKVCWPPYPPFYIGGPPEIHHP